MFHLQAHREPLGWGSHSRASANEHQGIFNPFSNDGGRVQEPHSTPTRVDESWEET